MALTRIFVPRTASEAAVVVALLEAHEIPAYLHNGHLASVLPGLSVNAYNSQSVMVPEERASDALELVANFRAAPEPIGDGSVLRNVFEWLIGAWIVPSRHVPRRNGRRLASFVALHEVPEPEHLGVAAPTFAVVLARDSEGVVLVFNRQRRVWELPGGFIDANESARDAAARELREEAGCTARNLCWLGLIEVDDGAAHFGAVYECQVDDAPAVFENEEVAGIRRWRQGPRPRPLGESDAALLNRFG
jgi:8-oxo-dGTP diphosphatase